MSRSSSTVAARYHAQQDGSKLPHIQQGRAAATSPPLEESGKNFIGIGAVIPTISSNRSKRICAILPEISVV
jgi:hypothetical protein